MQPFSTVQFSQKWNGFPNQAKCCYIPKPNKRIKKVHFSCQHFLFCLSHHVLERRICEGPVLMTLVKKDILRFSFYQQKDLNPGLLVRKPEPYLWAMPSLASLNSSIFFQSSGLLFLQKQLYFSLCFSQIIFENIFGNF